MIEIKDIYSVAGKDCNEDAIGYSDSYLFVIDGATGLTKTHITNEKSDARWFASELKSRISAQFDHRNENSITDIIFDIIQHLHEEYVMMANKKGIKLPPDYPSAGIALFKENNDKIEFYGLGDCVGVVKFKNGEMKVFRDKVLPSLDDISIAKMVEASKKHHISVFDAREYAMDTILKNRMKRNKKDGYMILDLSNEGTKNATTAVFNKDEVASIYVMSDGFAQLQDTFDEYACFGCLTRDMANKPLKELTEKLFKLQENDKDGNKHPRLKFRDDTTSGWALIK